MEFRYRATDGDRPPTATDTAPTQSPNSSLSFLSARPIPGCNSNFSLPSEDHHIREAIKREIEKEQIRQEITVAETARRRELIAEVVQEMAIEREMAIRTVAETTGMSLEDKLTMWINQKKLLPNEIQNNNNNLFRQIQNLMYTSPYSLVTSPTTQLPEATPVLESNKDKLIVLNRSDAIGAKRKAEDTQTDLEREKRKTASKAIPMSAETGEADSSKLPPCLGKLNSGKKVERKSKLKFKFWCDICKVGAFSQTVMRNHELGKKHIAAIKLQNESPEAASTSFIITLPASSITEPQSEDANVQQDQQKVAANETGEKARFWCEICNIRTYSEKVMETHKLGKKHKAMLEKQNNKPLADLDSNLITVPVRYLNDDSGEKRPVDHTKGKVHCLDKSEKVL